MVNIGSQYKEAADMVNKLTEKVNIFIRIIIIDMQEINRFIDSTSCTIKQTSNDAQDLAKGSEQATRAAVDISKASRKLADKAENHGVLVSKF